MRLAWGVVAVAMALALSGCSDDVVNIRDAITVEHVPACLTYPVEMAGVTYWMVPDDESADWNTNHEDPYGGTPQPQASAAWESDDDGRGYLYRYEDGSALFISATGNRIWFDQSERTYHGYC